MRKVIFILLFLMSFSTYADLDKSACADLIVANIQVQNPSGSAAFLKPYWEAICEGIIDHFKSNAVVLPTALLDSLSAPVTGTGTIK